MRIAMIGSGHVGQALMSALGTKHEVRFADRSDAATTAMWSEVIILAVPWAAALTVVGALGDLEGRVLIDATNPLAARDGMEALDRSVHRSGGEMIADAAPTARVVKAFNQTGAENMANAGSYSKPPMMFVAGDDADARATAATLVRDTGFEPLDGGEMAAARELEALAILWVRLASSGSGRAFAFSIAAPGDTK